MNRPVGARRTVELPKEAKKLYESGLTISEIASRFGVGRTTVTKRLREAGAAIRPSGERYRAVLTRQGLRLLYVEQGLSATEIAERFDCATGTVYRWLRMHGIPLKGVRRTGNIGLRAP